MRYDDMPRSVGAPSQYMVHTPHQFQAFVQFNNGRNPCFTSHNAFPAPEEVLVRYIPFDFDGKGKLENTLVDALALRDWAKNNGLQTRHVFTGGNGFHSYIEFDPQRTKANEGLRAVYRALQIRAIKEAKLRTADPAIVGDYRRILRIVGCQYVNSKSFEKTGLYSVEVPTQLLDAGTMDEVLDYARCPRPAVHNFDPTETLAEVMTRLDLKKEVEHERKEFARAPTIPYRGEGIPEMVRAFLPRPCINQGIMGRNPPHDVRFDAVVELKKMGQDEADTRNIIHEIALEAKWVDFDAKITDGYIRQIYRRNYDNPVSCQKLRAAGLCVGPTCHLFAAKFPQEVVANGS